MVDAPTARTQAPANTSSSSPRASDRPTRGPSEETVTPQAHVGRENRTSSGGTAKDLLNNMAWDILHDKKMSADEKAGILKELSIERLNFDSSDQVLEVMAALAAIIQNEPSGDVRRASALAMDHMTSLAEAEELEINWEEMRATMQKVQKIMKMDTDAVSGNDSTFLNGDEKPQEQREPQPPSADVSADRVEVRADEDALLAAQAKAVADIKHANLPVVPPSPEMMAEQPESGPVEPVRPMTKDELNFVDSVVSDIEESTAKAKSKPQPEVRTASTNPTRRSTETQNAEPAIEKYIRSVAQTDDDKSIRDLAEKVVKKIEEQNHAAEKPSPSTAPDLSEG